MPRPPPTPKELVGLTQNVLTLAFWALVGADHAGYVAVIDEEYKEFGFCVAETTFQSGFGNSFELCFIIDLLAFLLILCRSRTREHVGYGSTVFVHGGFHFLQFLYGYKPLETWPPFLSLVTYTLFTVVYLGGFGVGFKVGSMRTLALATAIIVGAAHTCIPDAFGFAFTNTWIYTTATLVAVNSPKSARSLGSSWAATLMFLGGALVPFCEAMLCNHGFKALGGHAVFDATIAIAMLAAVEGSTRPSRGELHASPKIRNE